AIMQRATSGSLAMAWPNCWNVVAGCMYFHAGVSPAKMYSPSVVNGEKETGVTTLKGAVAAQSPTLLTPAASKTANIEARWFSVLWQFWHSVWKFTYSCFTLAAVPLGSAGR